MPSACANITAASKTGFCRTATARMTFSFNKSARSVATPWYRKTAA